MKLPTIDAIALALAPIREEAVRQQCYIEVRLQVLEDDTWAIHTGIAQYDDDHTGFWGFDDVGPRSKPVDIAISLLEEVTDHVYIHSVTTCTYTTEETFHVVAREINCECMD